jgi:hypothetical protein
MATGSIKEKRIRITIQKIFFLPKVIDMVAIGASRSLNISQSNLSVCRAGISWDWVLHHEWICTHVARVAIFMPLYLKIRFIQCHVLRQRYDGAPHGGIWLMLYVLVNLTHYLSRCFEHKTLITFFWYLFAVFAILLH